MREIILDLCGGTGAWSRPYKEAGYDVRIITPPGQDIKGYHPPRSVYGVLAAPHARCFLWLVQWLKPRVISRGQWKRSITVCVSSGNVRRTVNDWHFGHWKIRKHVCVGF